MQGVRAPITLSLHLPNFNWPGVEPEGLFEHLVDIATTAEDSGFSSISMMDHLPPDPGVGPRTNHMFEGNTMLAALAARTSRVSLGLLVGGVMYRNPALLAKITTTHRRDLRRARGARARRRLVRGRAQRPTASTSRR